MLWNMLVYSNTEKNQTTLPFFPQLHVIVKLAYKF